MDLSSPFDCSSRRKEAENLHFLATSNELELPYVGCYGQKFNVSTLQRFYLLSSRLHSLLLFEGQEIAFFAADDKAFGNRFQFFPARANLVGFFLGDLIIGSSGGYDCEQVGKFLDDFIGRRDKICGMRFVGLGIQNEKAARFLADPLNQPAVLRAF